MEVQAATWAGKFRARHVLMSGVCVQLREKAESELERTRGQLAALESEHK